jgi:hypothetical protein
VARRTISILAILAILAIAIAAAAQVPQNPEQLVWGTFVAGPGRPQRREVSAEPGTIDLGTSPWRCGYGRIRSASINESDWSVQRVLACQRDQATVSSTASCRVHEGRVDEHAATLSLGTVGDEAHVTVTLSCRPR